MHSLSLGWRSATVPSLMLALTIASSAHAQASAQTTAGWSGWARCVIDVQGTGYADQQTHTWEITGGAPTVVGAFRVYPATWSVVGGGGLQRSQNKQSLTAQWSANGTSTGAPLAVFVRASDGQMIVQARHAQLRAVGAVKGYQQQTIDGTVKPAGILGLEAFEWTFPQISVAPGGTTASGSLVQPTHGAVAPMQPAGAQGTASCTWQFGRGAVTPPPAVAARAVPVAPR